MQSLVQNLIEAFDAAFCRGVEAWEECGTILVRLLEEHGVSVRDEILAKCKPVTSDMLAFFERVGRRQVNPQLWINESSGRKALRRCPYSEQIKYAVEPVELLIVDGEQKDTLLVGIDALSWEQTKQVFGQRHIRSLGEQRAFLEAKRPRPVASANRFTIKNGVITFHEPFSIRCSDLLREMTGK